MKNYSKYFAIHYYSNYTNYTTDSLFYYPLRVSSDIKQRRDYIPAEIVAKVKAKEIMLFVDCTFECNKRYLEDWWWSIGDYFGFEPEHVIFAMGGHASKLFPEYNIVEVDLFELQVLFQLKRKLPPHNTGLAPRKFACMNRGTKSHRLYTMLKIFEYGLIDQCHWSFINCMQDITVSEMNEILHNEFFEPENNFCNNMLADFAKLVPYTADNIGTSGQGYSRTPEDILSDLYDNVDFCVVTETIYESTEGLFLTEKTFRSMANGVPFVIMGQPGSVQKLRDRGFDTYDYLIDHSYDRLPDADRADAVADEIARLCTVDFSQYSYSLKISANHNYQRITDHEQYLQDLKSIRAQLLRYIRKEIGQTVNKS